MNLEDYLDRLHQLAENDKRRTDAQKKKKLLSEESDKSENGRLNANGW